MSSPETPPELTCPSCSGRITATGDLIDQHVRCRHCGHTFLLTEGLCRQRVESEEDSAGPGQGFRGRRFNFHCHRCGSVLEAGADQCGQEGKCPTCGVVFRIPVFDPRTGRPVPAGADAGDDQLPTPMHAYAAAGGKAPQFVRTEGGDLRIRCPRCDALAPADANNCHGCGLPFTLEGATFQVQPTVNGYAIVSFVFGLASLPAGLCVLGIVPALVALVTGVIAWRQVDAGPGSAGGKGLAVAGILCAVLGILIVLLTWS